jgi:DHA1 family tetracycline resistance protein-like MFS transporter
MKDKKALFVIFLVIFIDLLGFGIIIPVLPFFSENILQMSKTEIGLLTGIYSLMQFVFTPVWGSLSDVYGRKPILKMSLTGNVIAYTLMALVFTNVIPSVALLFIARAFAGFFSANLSAAQAVVSDVTTPEDRSKGMGIIGAAFGLGFVFGPALGGFLSYYFGYGVPLIFSAAFSLMALIVCISIFKETLPEDLRLINKNKFNIRDVKIINLKAVNDVIKHKDVGIYVIIFFFITFSFANIFGNFQYFLERKDGLGMNEEQTGFLLSFLGIIAAIVQSSLIKPFKKFIGEEKSVMFGNVLVAIGLFLIPFSTSVWILLGVLTILAFGNGLNNAMALGLISRNVSRQDQGGVLGINQSLSSLARFLGPLWGGFIYDRLGYHSPFISGSLFMIIITVISLYVLRDKLFNKDSL